MLIRVRLLWVDDVEGDSLYREALDGIFSHSEALGLVHSGLKSD
jgi:hypothetical protein